MWALVAAPRRKPFAEFHMALPDGNRSARLYLSDEDPISSRRTFRTSGGDTQDEVPGQPPARTIAYAIALIEKKAWDHGPRWQGIRSLWQPTQEACVDDTTSFLLIIRSHGFLKYHRWNSLCGLAERDAGRRPGEIISLIGLRRFRRRRRTRDPPSIPGSAPMARIRP